MGLLNNKKKTSVEDAIAYRKKGKHPEQCKAIDFFLVGDEVTTSSKKKGCLSKKTVNITKKWDMDDYCSHVQNKVNDLNLKAKAIEKIGLDESQINEIPPIVLYSFDRKHPNGNKVYFRTEETNVGGVWKTVTNIYSVTWIFFSSTQLYTYTYKFDTMSDDSFETTRDFFYKDITCIRTEHEVEEAIYERTVKGCFKKKGEQYVHNNKNWDTLQITVPNDSYYFTCTTTDTIEQSIQAAKAMIREKKQA